MSGTATVTAGVDPSARAGGRRAVRAISLLVVAAAIFVASFLLRFNDPGGSFAGLTDDHLFYLVRGWQILYGDLPVRDFVDHGAPLHFVVAAAVQTIGGRGPLAEVVFSAVALSLSAALTCVIAARASGSIALGGVAAVAQVLLEPRFYNYPKLLVYAVAVPAVWALAARVSVGRALLAAAITAVAFLFRHDHGVFVAIAAATMILVRRGAAWPERLRHLVVYGGLVLALLVPYLVFLQANGGVVSYFRQASAWAERDRERAPMRWPDPFEHRVTDATARGGAVGRAVTAIRDNNVAWLFYVEIALPLVALAVLALSPNAFRPGWPDAAAKIAAVAVLGIVLNAGFLRHPLEARLADPSFPHVVLLAWLGAVALRLFTTTGGGLWPSLRAYRGAIAAVVLFTVITMAAIGGIAVTKDLDRRLEKASMTGWGPALDRAAAMRARLEEWWPLDRWASPHDPGVIGLAYYLRSCTTPEDRVFVQDYLPQVIALSGRAFAGGHADLRSGFFNTPEAEQLTIKRLRQQSVPILALTAGEWEEGFRESFPQVAAYIAERYRSIGERALDERFAVELLVARDRVPTGHYPVLDAPCFG